MFQISVEEVFAAGHALRGYQGRCENLHGHNYKVRVTLEGESLDSVGLLYDFKDLREALQAAIRKLDHRLLNEIPPFDVVNPSAENLAKYFYEETTRLLSLQANPGEAQKQEGQGASLRVSLVTVWETDTTTATYFANQSEPRAQASGQDGGTTEVGRPLPYGRGSEDSNS